MGPGYVSQTHCDNRHAAGTRTWRWTVGLILAILLPLSAAAFGVAFANARELGEYGISIRGNKENINLLRGDLKAGFEKIERRIDNAVLEIQRGKTAPGGP